MEQANGLSLMAFNSTELTMPADMVEALNNFQQKVGKKNDKHSAIVKSNPFANNAEYYPIGYLQMKLDQIFYGLWEWKVNSLQVAGNAVVAYGDLRYFHPIAKTWITRSGVGAMPIELKSGSNANDAQNINHKAMQKNVPAAEAYAFKNAAAKIGNLFGRHLNRKDFAHDFVAEKPLNV